MLSRSIVLGISLALAAAPPHLQTHTSQRGVLSESSTSDAFNFLIGRWSVTGTAHVSALAARFHGIPQISGTWQATREPDGYTVRDDVRATDDAGRLYVNKHFSRRYDVREKRWSVVDGVNATVGMTTVERHGDEISVIIDSRMPNGESVLIRHRFSSIRPGSFTYAQDRSEDRGGSWTEPDFVLRASRQSHAAAR